jgi:hypothetical protein
MCDVNSSHYFSQFYKVLHRAPSHLCHISCILNILARLVEEIRSDRRQGFHYNGVLLGHDLELFQSSHDCPYNSNIDSMMLELSC